jgi:hypothetical protein
MWCITFGQLEFGALRHVRSDLRNDFDRQRNRFEKNRTATAVERLLRRTARELNHVKISGKGWKAIQPGVRNAYRQGRRAYRRALETPQAEHFHAWRKRAKDLWYQVTLVRPVWPEQMTAIADRLNALGEYLGDDHDLVVVDNLIHPKSPSGAASGRTRRPLNFGADAAPLGLGYGAGARPEERVRFYVARQVRRRFHACAGCPSSRSWFSKGVRAGLC